MIHTKWISGNESFDFGGSDGTDLIACAHTKDDLAVTTKILVLKNNTEGETPEYGVFRFWQADKLSERKFTDLTETTFKMDDKLFEKVK